MCKQGLRFILKNVHERRIVYTFFILEFAKKGNCK